VSISSDGNTVAYGLGNYGLRIVDASSGKTIRTLAGHRGIVRAVSISPDGNWAVSGGRDRRIAIWNLATGQMTKSLVGHVGLPRSLVIRNMDLSSDGSRVVTIGDSTVRLLDAQDGHELSVRVLDTGGQAVCFSPTEPFVAGGLTNPKTSA
jgi:WD40 repeat protein